MSNVAVASETLLYLDYDNDTRSVKEGPDLVPYVYDYNHNLVRSANVGFGRIPNGALVENKLDTTAAAEIMKAGEELTIEFFIKGNPGSLKEWEYLLTIGGSWNPCIRVDAGTGKTMRLTVWTSGGDDVQTSSISLVDGKWHHVAVTVKPISGGSHIEAFVDYNSIYSKDKTSEFKYSQCGVLTLNNRQGSACGGCDVDEIRYSRGVLAKSEFLRLDDTPPPKDGTTLLYLPLDTDAKTIAYADKQGNVSGTADFVGATRTRTKVKEFGTDVKLRDLNLAYLQQDGHDLYVYNNFWALEKSHCQTCTIEFFIKGGSSVKSWEVPLCYGNWTSAGSYGFMIQVDDSKNIRFKPGVGTADEWITIPVDLSKEKWHHVAIETQPSVKEGYENGSRFDAFVDYGMQSVAGDDFKDQFNGLVEGRVIFNPNKNAHCAIDELRVTQGLLPVSKFLSFGKLGLFIVVK